jgi:hypothetical protein
MCRDVEKPNRRDPVCDLEIYAERMMNFAQCGRSGALNVQLEKESVRKRVAKMCLVIKCAQGMG